MLVHQDSFGLIDQCSRNGDALFHAAEVFRVAVSQPKEL
jgi:hypothetical protein